MISRYDHSLLPIGILTGASIHSGIHDFRKWCKRLDSTNAAQAPSSKNPPSKYPSELCEPPAPECHPQKIAPVIPSAGVRKGINPNVHEDAPEKSEGRNHAMPNRREESGRIIGGRVRLVGACGNHQYEDQQPDSTENPTLHGISILHGIHLLSSMLLWLDDTPLKPLWAFFRRAGFPWPAETPHRLNESHPKPNAQ